MSTNNSNLLQNQHSVSSDMLYNMKPSSGSSRRYRANIPSTSGVGTNGAAPSTQLNFLVPCGSKNTYLDGINSCIKLTIKNNDAGNTMFLDGCGAILINMITVYHAGNLIDQTANYGLLFNFLQDFQGGNFATHLGSMSAFLRTSGTFTSAGDVTLSTA